MRMGDLYKMYIEITIEKQRDVNEEREIFGIWIDWN